MAEKNAKSVGFTSRVIEIPRPGIWQSWTEAAPMVMLFSGVFCFVVWPKWTLVVVVISIVFSGLYGYVGAKVNERRRLQKRIREVCAHE